MSKSLIAIAVSLFVLNMSGCALQVGKDEFACPNSSPGATCSSPRQIHDLTDSRDNLEGLKVTQGKIVGIMGKDGEVIDMKDATPEQKSAAHLPADPVAKVAAAPVTTAPKQEDVYEPLDNRRQDVMPPAQLVQDAPQTADTNLPAGAVPGVDNEHGRLMLQRQMNAAPAPEPLAVLQQPKNMRILVSAWTDSDGDLHMPGYVYVEIQPRKWIVGEQANSRPSRIVPLQVKQQSQDELRRQEKAQRGYTSLGVGESK